MLTGSKQISDEQGFTYLALLVFIVIIGILLSVGSQVWVQSAQREKEQELLFVGDQFRQAIGMYYQHTPGAVKTYPKHLEDLLVDTRYPAKQRYLRKLFRDPLTGQAKWGLVESPDGGVMGVYSLSVLEPIKLSNFRVADQAFEGSGSYADWRFTYIPPK